MFITGVRRSLSSLYAHTGGKDLLAAIVTTADDTERRIM
jgi:hypothetical protein